MKVRNVLMLAGAVFAMSSAVVALAQSSAPQNNDGKTADAQNDTRSEAEKRAARRAATEARAKQAAAQGQNPAPREEEEEEGKRKP
ncbi:MAG: hypothetical protein ABW178_05935 [Pseudoxanthomonas sp.]